MLTALVFFRVRYRMIVIVRLIRSLVPAIISERRAPFVSLSVIYLGDWLSSLRNDRAFEDRLQESALP